MPHREDILKLKNVMFVNKRIKWTIQWTRSEIGTQFGCYKLRSQKYPFSFKIIENICHWHGKRDMGALLSIKRVSVSGWGRCCRTLALSVWHAEWQFPCLQGQEWREEWALSMQFASCNSERLYSQIKHQEFSDVSNSIYKHRFRSWRMHEWLESRTALLPLCPTARPSVLCFCLKFI